MATVPVVDPPPPPEPEAEAAINNTLAQQVYNIMGVIGSVLQNK